MSKLGSQWKIIHDFKPTEYLQEASKRHLGLRVSTGDVKAPGSSFVGICLSFPKLILSHGFIDDNNQDHAQQVGGSTQLPKVGEWTRIEIGHEKMDGKYFLSLSVGGKELGRKEVTDHNMRNLTDVKVRVGPAGGGYQPGFIQRLVILEKP